MTGDSLLPFHLPAVQQNVVSNNSGDVTFSYFNQPLLQTEHKLKMQLRSLSKMLAPTAKLEGCTSELAILTLMAVATSFLKLYIFNQFLQFKIHPQ
jgi:hypothetical protein